MSPPAQRQERRHVTQQLTDPSRSLSVLRRWATPASCLAQSGLSLTSRRFLRQRCPRVSSWSHRSRCSIPFFVAANRAELADAVLLRLDGARVTTGGASV